MLLVILIYQQQFLKVNIPLSFFAVLCDLKHLCRKKLYICNFSAISNYLMLGVGTRDLEIRLKGKGVNCDKSTSTSLSRVVTSAFGSSLAKYYGLAFASETSTLVLCGGNRVTFFSVKVTNRPTLVTFGVSIIFIHDKNISKLTFQDFIHQIPAATVE